MNKIIITSCQACDSIRPSDACLGCMPEVLAIVVDEDCVIECQIEHWTDIIKGETYWILHSKGRVIKAFLSFGDKVWYDITDTFRQCDCCGKAASEVDNEKT